MKSRRKYKKNIIGDFWVKMHLCAAWHYLAKHAHLSVKLYASFILTIMEQETDYKDLLGVI